MSHLAFSKYHATGNDFIVVDSGRHKKSRRYWSSIAKEICMRNRGIGADGLIILRKLKPGFFDLELFNSDGSWAEKSGNGLRIAALHCHVNDKRTRQFKFKTGAGTDLAVIGKKNSRGWDISCEMGEPKFETKNIPVKSRQKFFINRLLTIDGADWSLTCLSTGNPHAVLFVEHFDFDWMALGAAIETHRIFPNRTNVEFVKVINRRNAIVAVWERGAGPTGSSGTGASATVAAGVMNGLLDRRCRVDFTCGSLKIHWRKSDNRIELSGHVNHIGDGLYNCR